MVGRGQDGEAEEEEFVGCDKMLERSERILRGNYCCYI